jgi:hypothetical protein
MQTNVSITATGFEGPKEKGPRIQGAKGPSEQSAEGRSAEGRRQKGFEGSRQISLFLRLLL